MRFDWTYFLEIEAYGYITVLSLSTRRSSKILYLSFPLKSVAVDISIFHVCSGCKLAQSMFMFKFSSVEPTNTTATTTTYSNTFLIDRTVILGFLKYPGSSNNTLMNALREVAEERQPSFWKIRTDPMLYKNFSIDWQQHSSHPCAGSFHFLSNICWPSLNTAAF